MGDRLEERKDFTSEVTVKIPEAKKLAQVGDKVFLRARYIYSVNCRRNRAIPGAERRGHPALPMSQTEATNDTVVAFGGALQHVTARSCLSLASISRTARKPEA